MSPAPADATRLGDACSPESTGPRPPRAAGAAGQPVTTTATHAVNALCPVGTSLASHARTRK
jgi:hypothetical protein